MTKPALSAEPGPSFRPLYLQIKDLLVRSLEMGEWRPGEAIASEVVLASRFGVSQGTARKAIDALAAEHLVVRRQGKGTFVATHTEEAQSSFRFLRIRPDGGSELPASRLLEVKPGDPVVVVRRVLEWGGRPIVVDDITLPAALFRGLTRAKLESYAGSMYGFFETQFGVRMLNAQERIKAVPADPATAGVLGVPAGTPLLAVDRVAHTYGGRPVEFRRGLCSTAAHHYFTVLG